MPSVVTNRFDIRVPLLAGQVDRQVVRQIAAGAIHRYGFKYERRQPVYRTAFADWAHPPEENLVVVEERLRHRRRW